MLQEDLAGDFIMGIVESHTVRDFAEVAFHSIGMNIQWKGAVPMRSAYQMRIELL